MFDEDYVLRGPEPPEIPSVGVGTIVFEKLKEHDPEIDVLIEANTGRKCNYAEFLRLSVNAAVGLREIGVSKGTIVCFVGKNGVDIGVAAVATLFLGGVLAPMDPSMTAYELGCMFRIIEPKLIICDADVSSKIEDAISSLEMELEIITLQGNDSDLKSLESIMGEGSIDDFETEVCDDTEEIVLIVCSSGTTGLPKAVGLTHKNVHFVSALDPIPNMLFLHCGNFFWISGITIYLACLLNCHPNVIITEISEINIFKGIQEYAPLGAFFSPSLLDSLIKHPDVGNYDLSSMRLIITGGSPLAKQMVDMVHEIWRPDMILGQIYGMSEVTGALLKARPDCDISSVGTVNPGTAIKIIDVETGENLPPGESGEILCQSFGMMKGYINNPEATANIIHEDGWLYSGDIGYISPEGLVYVTGRMKELLKIENHQISPAEIEAVISGVPGVRDVGVVGIKVDEDTLHLMALVVKTEESEVTEEDIVKRVNETLSDFKQLKGGVCFVDLIPRTTTGKLKRSILQEMAENLYMPGF